METKRTSLSELLREFREVQDRLFKLLKPVNTDVIVVTDEGNLGFCSRVGGKGYTILLECTEWEVADAT